jgi:hypothetical protein
MILQPLSSITVGKVKCSTGEYRFKLTKLVAIHYKLLHHIRYVQVNKSGGGEYLKNNGLITDIEPNKFYVDVSKTTTRNVNRHDCSICTWKHKYPGDITISY